MARIATLCITLVLLLLVGVASARAATYYVTTAGDDANGCTQADPCLTIQRAIVEHRVAPTAGDVIDVGAGTFVGNVEANDTADDGLTIRGTLGGGGSRDTTIRASGAGTDDCVDAPCAVVLGLSPGAAVTLQDADVDTEGAEDSITPIAMEGGSDLIGVHARSQQDALIFQIVDVGPDNGTLIDHSTVDATGTSFAEGIFLRAGATLQESHVLADTGPAIDQCDCSSGLVLTRTWLELPPSWPGPDLLGVADLTLDSSLITGGGAGAFFDGDNGGSWTVENSTIDVGQPGRYDSAKPGIVLGLLDGAAPIDLTVNSSILAEAIATLDSGSGTGPGSITCDYTDLQLVVADPQVTVDCAPGSNGNRKSNVAKQFVGGSPFDWSLTPTAPAVDRGDPGPLGPGVSTTDLAGNPRVLPGTPAGCPDGIRDMGAYERAAIDCTPQAVKPPAIERSSSPTAGSKLSSNVGTWLPAATSYTRQWLRCDAGNVDDCVELPGRNHSTYIPTNDDAGSVLRLSVIGHNSVGDSSPVLSAPTGVVAASVPVVRQAPAITGASPPTVGTKLSSSRGTWLPVATSYARQWKRCDEFDFDFCTPITGATGSTYRPKAGDVGSVLRLEVVATNSVGASTPATSAPTLPVQSG